MSFPAGLSFRQRRAEHDGAFYFKCARTGHPPGQRTVKRTFRARRSRELWITRHDATFHDELLAASLGVQVGPSLREIVDEFMKHIRDLEKRGKRDHKTVIYYDGITAKLVEHFGGDTPLGSIGRRASLHYAKQRVAFGSSSQGVRLVKELKVVRRLQAFADLKVMWELPTDDISPLHRERVSIPLEDIRDFFRAMPEGSVERAFTATKFITMLRNEELYAANVHDVTLQDDGTGELSYYLRNKQTGDKVRHLTHLPAELVLILRPLLERRKLGSPLFAGRGGRRLGPWSLRKRFIKASEIATKERRKQDPEAKAVNITALGQFRHEASTIAYEELGAIAPVSDQLGHTNEATFQKHYKLRRKARTRKQSKAVTEMTASKLVN